MCVIWILCYGDEGGVWNFDWVVYDCVVCCFDVLDCGIDVVYVEIGQLVWMGCIVQFYYVVDLCVLLCEQLVIVYFFYWYGVGFGLVEYFGIEVEVCFGVGGYQFDLVVVVFFLLILCFGIDVGLWIYCGGLQDVEDSFLWV